MLIGNLTRDPELRYTPQGTGVCTFGMATNRSWTPSDGGERQEETEYHRIVAWSKLGEICSQLLYKGRKVYVEGRMQTRRFTGQDGNEREITEVVIDSMIALGAPKGKSNYGDDSYGYADDYDQASTEVTSDAGTSNGGETPADEGETEDDSKDKGKKEAEESEDVDVDDIPF
jgi:single-strand DNA-binding protein